MRPSRPSSPWSATRGSQVKNSAFSQCSGSLRSHHLHHHLHHNLLNSFYLYYHLLSYHHFLHHHYLHYHHQHHSHHLYLSAVIMWPTEGDCNNQWCVFAVWYRRGRSGGVSGVAAHRYDGGRRLGGDQSNGTESIIPYKRPFLLVGPAAADLYRFLP